MLQCFIDQCEKLFPAANLTREEVIALRLYTGPMFVWYNHVLRWLGQGIPYDDMLLKKGESWFSWHKQCKYPAHWPNSKSAEEMLYLPFRTTIHVLNSAVIKLSRTQKATKHRVRLSTIWFGSKKIPQPDSHEDGCMH
jgi:hypothetical protein